MKVAALITARGGSRSIPGKNIAPVAGRPLIAWSIQAALGSRRVQRTIVSTDDPQIAEVARKFGAEVPFLRPGELAGERSSHISVVLHALEWLESANAMPDYLLLLQPTSPLRTVEDIDAACSLAEQTNADSIVGVCAAHNHPYLVKKRTPDGTLVDFVTTDLKYLRRQDLPPAYALNGAIYLTRPSALRQHKTFLPPRTYGYVMPAARSLEVDEPWDLYLIRRIMEDEAWLARNCASPAAPWEPISPASSSPRPG